MLVMMHYLVSHLGNYFNRGQMSGNNSIVFRKVRNTEYMKKFRDPKWETFSKCYEDCVKYRLSRRMMEQTHNPLFGNGWDSGSESSGRSSPKLNDVNVPNGKHYASSSESRNENAEVLNNWKPQVNGDIHTDDSTVDGSPPLGELMFCVNIIISWLLETENLPRGNYV